MNSVYIYEPWNVCLSNGYAYINNHDNLLIVDIDPPGSEQIVNSIGTQDLAYDIEVEDGYVYLAGGYYGIEVFDIDPFETASPVCTIYAPDNSEGIQIFDGFAYVANGENGFQIIKLW
jgi:hypothetical protein